MDMRKDSEMFLKKILDYRNNIGKNNFEFNFQYFNDIPSIETAIYDILDDLVRNNCLTSKSQVIDLEGDISINLTLDGITYFDDVKERNSDVIFNISGGQVNIAKDNGKIDAVMGNTEPQKERKKIDVPMDKVYQRNESTSETGKKVFISYSWVPESNKEWVRKLAQKLEQDGVEVVIDYKDLRLGHDKYAFMERRNGKLYYFCSIPQRTITPEGFLYKEIPSYKYLVVEHIGAMDKIYETYGKIYEEIIPSTSYIPIKDIILHVEKYDIEIWIPIQD